MIAGEGGSPCRHPGPGAHRKGRRRSQSQTKSGGGLDSTKPSCCSHSSAETKTTKRPLAGGEKKNCEKSGVCPLQLAFNLKGNRNKSIEWVVLKVPCQPPFALIHCQGVRYYFLIQETMQATADISLVLSVTQAKYSSLVFAQEHAGKILFAKKE